MLSLCEKTKTACKVRKNDLDLGISLKKNMENILGIAFMTFFIGVFFLFVFATIFELRSGKKHKRKHI